MKRFLFLVVLVVVAFWILRSHRLEPTAPAPAPRSWWNGRHRAPEGAAGRHFAAEARLETRRALAEARRALTQAREEAHRALDEARNEIRASLDEARAEFASDQERDGGSAQDVQDATAAPGRPLEQADGLPVPIVPGTRVTEVEARPPHPAKPSIRSAPATAAQSRLPAGFAEDASGSSHTPIVTGLLSATEERAKAAAHDKLARAVAEWLDPDVPMSWAPPAGLLNAMVLATRTAPVHKDYGTVYETTLAVDVSPQRRASLIEAYNRELVRHRLVTLGAALAFVLTCLASICGYVCADEATKGYYTKWLRMLAAAGVGAAGVIIYQLAA
jgi:hypothetical protein